MTIETAILAGGCFWGMEDLLRKLPGVSKTEVGYIGGRTDDPTYKTLKGSGHAEAVKIEFDPNRLSYRSLLEFFFQIHDPSTTDRQGNDIGEQYRSAIFAQTEDQREIAKDVIRAVDASKRWPGTVKTKIERAGRFTRAENFHQDYLEKNPGGYTCHWVRPNWTLAADSKKSEKG